MVAAAHAAERGAYKALCRWHLHLASVNTRRGNRTDVESVRRSYYLRADVELFRARGYVSAAEYQAIGWEPPRDAATLADECIAAKAYFRETYPDRFEAPEECAPRSRKIHRQRAGAGL